ncbi:hypothetical protein EVAR_48737_1 [Eumeta japonica]|uniref:Uncharacterized protein n=1 Tax=Eumeta variegata TaxID=151549 RepID=A0A4C1YKV4_EUMVA|nr:hypothetical protein EVAR_48737_1 [Eumeta japonica]
MGTHHASCIGIGPTQGKRASVAAAVLATKNDKLYMTNSRMSNGVIYPVQFSFRLAFLDEDPLRGWCGPRGRINLTHYLREDRPSMVTAEDNISTGRFMIKTDKE